MEPVAGCLACDLLVGVRPLPGGRLAESSGWVVEHTVGPLGLGTLVVKPVRHVVHVAELTDAESAALGPLLRRVAAAVTEVVRPEQVYVCLWSHSDAVPCHIHFVVQPVTKADMERFDALGPGLQEAMFRAGEVPGEAEVEAVSHRLRAVLGTEPDDGDHRLSSTGAGAGTNPRLGAEAKEIVGRELRGVGE